jgi:6-phosphogluconolactonase
MNAEVVVLPSPAAVAEALADRTAAALRAALAQKPRVTLCLTGGSTPVPAYERLAGAEVEWDRVHVFWGDERSVPPDHDESNYAMAARTLLRPAGVPDSNVHRMPGECPPEEGSAVYEQALAQFFGDDLWFDVLHLGMGGDGHTASLFPGSPALDERDRRVVPAQSPPSAAVRDRLSLTLPALHRAGLCLVAAAGEAKREAFGRVLDAYDGDAPGPDAPPAARVSAEGDLVWLVDRALAQGLLDDDGTGGHEKPYGR